MSTPRLLAAGAFALALAIPAPALAQSAGDQQYSDPFAGTTPKQAPSKAPSGGRENTAVAKAPSTNSGSADTSTAAQTASATGRIPNTGFDTPLIAATGLAMLLTGLVLWRLTAPPVRFLS